MKRRAVLLSWILFIAAVGYGEPVVNSFGGALFPEGDTSIQLRDLAIVLEQQGKQMSVQAEYRFYNPEIAKSVTVGFMTLPHLSAARQLDTPLGPNIEQLRVVANGRSIGFEAKPIAETAFQQELKEINELSYLYHGSINFLSGENEVRLSYTFLPSQDNSGAHGQIYYPFTVTPAVLWAKRWIESFSLEIKMEPGTMFTVPRNLGSPSAPNPWRLTGRGKIERDDGTGDSDGELLYVYAKDGSLLLEREKYMLERELMIQIYKPLNHVEPLKSMYWRVYKGSGLEGYSLEDLNKARNTILALHGYKFRNPDLLRYFSRFFWYDPDPAIPDSIDILSGEEQILLHHIMSQENDSGQTSSPLSVFLERFRSACVAHDWQEVLDYLDPAYLKDQLDHRHDGEREAFLRQFFGGIDPEQIREVEYLSFPESVAEDKVVARFDTKLHTASTHQVIKYQIRRDNGRFHLVGPHNGITIYKHKEFRVQDAQAISVKIRSIGDPYLRCYSTWIENGSGGYINLDGGDCDPAQWRASHCSCPTVAGSKTVRYDLYRYTDTPYRGKVIVAVSSYVGYWQAEVRAETEAAPGLSHSEQGRPWSTSGDLNQRHAEVKDIRYWIANGVLHGEATFLAWNRSECPACIQQIVLISDRKTGGLYDAVCIDIGIPGVFPGIELRRSFQIRFPDAGTKVWAFPALQYNCGDAISLARQNFQSYIQNNAPIIGD